MANEKPVSKEVGATTKATTQAKKTRQSGGVDLKTKIKYLNDIGVTCENKDEAFINNLYYASIKFNGQNDRTQTVAINSMSSLKLITSANRIDAIMRAINRRIKGFDSVKRFNTNLQKTKEALEDHQYFGDKIEAVLKSLEEISKEAREKGYPFTRTKKTENTDTPKETKEATEKTKKAES